MSNIDIGDMHGGSLKGVRSNDAESGGKCSNSFGKTFKGKSSDAAIRPMAGCRRPTQLNGQTRQNEIESEDVSSKEPVMQMRRPPRNLKRKRVVKGKSQGHASLQIKEASMCVDTERQNIVCSDPPALHMLQALVSQTRDQTAQKCEATSSKDLAKEKEQKLYIASEKVKGMSKEPTLRSACVLMALDGCEDSSEALAPKNPIQNKHSLIASYTHNHHRKAINSERKSQSRPDTPTAAPEHQRDSTMIARGGIRASSHVRGESQPFIPFEKYALILCTEKPGRALNGNATTDDVTSTWAPPAPSVASGRRSRGFQPSEVGKTNQNRCEHSNHHDASALRTGSHTHSIIQASMEQSGQPTTMKEPSTPSNIEIITGPPQNPPESVTTASNSGWDDTVVDLDAPFCNGPMPLSGIPNAAVRANMAKLGTYKFPRPKDQMDGVSSSFKRQLAHLENGVNVGPQQRERARPRASLTQSEEFSRLQAPINLVSQATAQTRKERQPESDGAQNLAENQKSEQAILPHLRIPDTSHNATKVQSHNGSGGVKLPPHLRTPQSHVGHTEPLPPRHAQDDKMTRKQTIAAMQHYQVPLGLGDPAFKAQSLSQDTTKPQDRNEYRPAINVDEEVAASLEVPSIMDDGVIAASIQMEDFSPGPSASTLNQTWPEENFTTASPSSRPWKPRASGPQNSDREKGQEPTETGGSHHSHARNAFKTSESAVKAEKRPITDTENAQPDSTAVALYGQSWDGQCAPPPLAEDWVHRQQQEPSDRVPRIESWMQDNANGEARGRPKLDVNHPYFRSGAGLAQGDSKLTSPIDDIAHTTFPNKDDFSRARREQRASDEIAKFKPRANLDGKHSPSNSSGKKKTGTNRASYRALALEDDVSWAPNKYTPKANIYMRPAEIEDMKQCTKIYNHYVQETSHVCELQPVDNRYWNGRFQEAVDECTPFVVAIHMGEKKFTNLRDVHRKKHENIVGFAVAANYGGPKTAYRHSVELDMFVHHAHLRQGIGNTLLDRMLSALAPQYSLLERTLFLGEYIVDYWIGGGHKICKTVIVNILHDAEDTRSVEWKKKWLSQEHNGFECVGTLPKIGIKRGKP